MPKIQPIKNHENICFKCLQVFNNNDLTKYYIRNRGFGSKFDGMDTYIQLCNNCKQYINEIWFNEKPIINPDDGCTEIYQYENELMRFINSLPIQSQELFWNSLDKGTFGNLQIDPQDWIDLQLNRASDKIKKKYGLPTKAETKAYLERYSTCNNVVNILCEDHSILSGCIYGWAFGEANQQPDKNHVWKSCYKCKYYIKRREPMKAMTADEFEEYQKFVWAKTIYLELRDKYEK